MNPSYFCSKTINFKFRMTRDQSNNARRILFENKELLSFHFDLEKDKELEDCGGSDLTISIFL